MANATLSIDPRAGTHFATDKIFVTPHACDEATKDFGVDRSKAPTFVMGYLRKASFISEVVSDSGNPARLFGYKRMAIVVDIVEPTVITVYPQDTENIPVNDAVTKILARSIRLSERKLKAESKRLSVKIAELNVRKAECELKLARTSSRKIALSMSALISDINAEVREIERQVFEMKREHTRLARCIIAYI